ncbi:CCHC-type domain-containing protein [Abeliophyllum distichum]|uniref:CCHC-type domain-containing protein n=1 Tax=Abeliophyllum distichum TaxID=126358 RepID=A0ABD1Q9G0_9LAMI
MGGPSMEAKANIAESSSKNMKRKHSSFAPKKNENNQKNKKFKGDCYNCGKPGHRAIDCRKPKKQNDRAHVVETGNLTEGVQEMHLSAVISECNSVGNPKGMVGGHWCHSPHMC